MNGFASRLGAALIVVGISLGMVGCTPRDAPSTPSPFVTPEPDELEVDVPKGYLSRWEYLSTSKRVFWLYPEDQSTPPYLKVRHTFPESDGKVPNTRDAARYTRLDEASRYARTSKVELLTSDQIPLKLLDDSEAWGFGIEGTTKPDLTAPLQVWYVGRDDGVWEIQIRGVPGETDVPKELEDTLKFIRWAKGPE